MLAMSLTEINAGVIPVFGIPTSPVSIRHVLREILCKILKVAAAATITLLAGANIEQRRPSSNLFQHSLNLSVAVGRVK